MRAIGCRLFALSLLASCTASQDITAPPAFDHVVITNPSCGDVIVSDVRLETDLTCAGDGLVVTGSGITINLNGHTISGPGAFLGIRVVATRDVSIHGGTIRGFLRGVNVTASTGIVIKDNVFTANNTGVLLEASSGNTIKSNVARQNAARAFMLRPNLTGTVLSTNNDVVDNILIDNPTGIYLIRQPGNTFKGNAISGATVAAIDLDPAPLGATGNVFKGNLLETSGVGIRFSAGWTDNTVLGNTIQLNTCAFQGPSAGNTFQGNTLIGNVTDHC